MLKYGAFVPVIRANVLGFIALYLFSHSHRRESMGNILAHHPTQATSLLGFLLAGSQEPYRSTLPVPET